MHSFRLSGVHNWPDGGLLIMRITDEFAIPNHELVRVRYTSEGKAYSLKHPKELTIPMRYKGEKIAGSNPQGWERNNVKFFKTLKSQFPEYFGKKNSILINDGKNPIVDPLIVKYFPQFKEYMNEILIHHHIGGNGLATAIPQKIHEGFGEIHSIENSLKITQHAEKFSSVCKQICHNDPSNYGKTQKEFLSLIQEKDNLISKINSIKATNNSTDQKEKEVINQKSLIIQKSIRKSR